MGILKEIKERFSYVAYTLRHRKALNDLAKGYGYSFFWHDLDKVFLYPILGKALTHKLHRSWSKHHYRDGDIVNKVEAMFDWECARYTKPDKPLDAYDTWKKYYPNVDMAPVLKHFGFWHNQN